MHSRFFKAPVDATSPLLTFLFPEFFAGKKLLCPPCCLGPNLYQNILAAFLVLVCLGVNCKCRPVLFGTYVGR